MHAVDAPVQVGALAITQPPEHDASPVGSGAVVDHADPPPPSPPVVEATTSKQVLAKVSRIGMWMTQWRAVILAIRVPRSRLSSNSRDSSSPARRRRAGRRTLWRRSPTRTRSLTSSRRSGPRPAWLTLTGTTAERLMGPQVQTLALSLEACAGHWPHPGGPISAWPEAQTS